MDKQNKIIVVGIGPGNPDYIVPKGLKTIQNARYLVGGKRALTEFAQAGQDTCAITADIQGVMAFIRNRLPQADVVVMVSGDPGYYSLLDALRREFAPEQIAVIPGISSMQYAFAKIALPWHDAALVSFHGRVPEAEAIKYQPGKIMGMLTDRNYNSHTIAKILRNNGWPEETEFYICSRLSYEDEAIYTATLQNAADFPVVTHGILIVKS
ncbi:precorrin-6Y C5,15-methyltransferase (decarboxylating) [Selenomonas ruminantium]|uniref:Precorrin-6Y C5,15-methyltransferase (Decarboxylating) n=1 Tax=Selenomonas ruminantium TaxID=971 RepID=A0A1M6XYN5_SELRU|nr:precorrin-6y C5,15-methyltransferase (decarboxylating) subunit CbiE [Selenomonas ruminantium]SHL11142.1 precorrin-6Y C5,15-methyltransferase (decarboxylating) [Selenomonas ruminantium]